MDKITGVTINDEPVEFVEGYSMPYQGGLSREGLELDRWDGWLDLRITKKHREKMALLSSKKSVKLIFFTGDVKNQSNDARVSLPLPEGDLFKVLVTYRDPV